MSVFISYTHNDEDFVEKLCLELFRYNVPFWRDKWQLRVGDSITNSIEDALDKAPFVCAVISNNSIKSQWFKREITAALNREIEENKFLILPIIIDNCKIPLFLKDKLYADFRKDFDVGLKAILNTVADTYNLFSGKITNQNKTTSFGTDVIIHENGIVIDFDIISEDNEHDYFILTKVKFIGSQKTLDYFKSIQTNDETSEFIRNIIVSFGQLPEIANKRIVVGGKDLARETVYFNIAQAGFEFRVDITSKKVGIDNGKSVMLNLGMLFQFYNDPSSGVI